MERYSNTKRVLRSGFKGKAVTIPFLSIGVAAVGAFFQIRSKHPFTSISPVMLGCAAAATGYSVVASVCDDDKGFGPF